MQVHGFGISLRYDSIVQDPMHFHPDILLDKQESITVVL